MLKGAGQDLLPFFVERVVLTLILSTKLLNITLFFNTRKFPDDGLMTL